MKIGVLGGGQLGRMLALSGVPLGHEFVFLDAKEDACSQVAGTLLVGENTNEDLLQQLAEHCDVVTYESENTPIESVELLEKTVPVYPPKRALEVTQDRLAEKTFCQEHSIPTAQFFAVENSADLESATKQLGLPCILKTRRLGYDGKGQVFIKTEADREEAKKLANEQSCILEQFVAFEREVSIIATRAKDGKIMYYPLAQNVHREGILHTSHVPAETEEKTETQARAIAQTFLEDFDYIGTLAIEFFVLADGNLLVNELAPRVHNSGHWTIEGAATSQFENHVRALTGMHLGSTEIRVPSTMINIIGTYPPLEALESIEGAHIHFYDKQERAKRKIGHVTVCHQNSEILKRSTEQIEALLRVDK